MHKLAQKIVHTEVPIRVPHLRYYFLILTEVLIVFFFIFVRLTIE